MLREPVPGDVIDVRNSDDKAWFLFAFYEGKDIDFELGCSNVMLVLARCAQDRMLVLSFDPFVDGCRAPRMRTVAADFVVDADEGSPFCVCTHAQRRAR